MAERQLHLNINALHAGFYASAWREPESDPKAFFSIEHYINIARIAEKAKFDAFFLADVPSVSDRIEYRSILSLEPTVVLASVAAATTHIGLIATASTSSNEPYNIARRFATLDHASGGRAGWNIVTTADGAAARNFGLPSAINHRERYDRAKEFASVVGLLWDSWEDDAVVGDKERPELVETSRVHPIGHKGAFYSVEGPLNIPRPPQGRPILVQAGDSEDGRDLAAAHADAVFAVAQTLEDAATYARDLRIRAAAYGRRPEDIVILPGLATVIGSTEAEAKRREADLWERIPTDYSVARLAGALGVPVERLKLDEHLPSDIAPPSDGGHGFANATLWLARRGELTVRQLIRALGGGTGHRILVGTPEQIADELEIWFRAGVADGFNLMPDVLPTGLEHFVDGVVPILQKRGLFRTDYTGTTLRDHFGLARPPSAFARSA